MEPHSPIFANFKPQVLPHQSHALFPKEQKIVREIFPLKPQVLFDVLFQPSKFVVDFYETHNSNHVQISEWTRDKKNLRTRIVNASFRMMETFNSKTYKVTEYQQICSNTKPGEIYLIDVTRIYTGLPYSRSFTTSMRFSLKEESSDRTSVSLYARVTYNKYLSKAIKDLIEKYTSKLLNDFYSNMLFDLKNRLRGPSAVRKITFSDKAVSTEDNVCVSGLKSRKTRKYPFQSRTVETKEVTSCGAQKETKWFFLVGCVMFLLIISILSIPILIEFRNIKNIQRSLEDNKAHINRLEKLLVTPKSDAVWNQYGQENEAVKRLSLEDLSKEAIAFNHHLLQRR